MPRKRVSGTRSSAQRVHLEVSRSAARSAQLAPGREPELAPALTLGLFEAPLMAATPAAASRPSWHHSPDSWPATVVAEGSLEAGGADRGPVPLPGSCVIELDIA
jgi:hypothetical protein